MEEYNPREVQRLIPGFIRGYTQALLDVQKVFEEEIGDLKLHHKRMSDTYIRKLIKSIIDNRESVREQIGFIRYNTKKDDFENYNPNVFKKCKK